MFDFETIKAKAADFVDERLRPDATEQARRDNISAEAQEKSKAIARAWANFADTVEGRLALETMLDVTIRRVKFHYQPGIGTEHVALSGVFREGQDALAWEIMRQVALGDGVAVMRRDF